MKGIAAVCSAILLMSACSSDDAIVGRLRSNSDGGQAVAAAGAGNAEGPESQDCGPTNPSVEIRSANEEQVFTTCTGRIASTHFTNALCVCSDAAVNGSLQTRGFDSSQGTYQTGLSDDSGAAIAVNGGYQASGYTDVGGSLSVAGPGGVTFTGYLSGRGDFRAAGDVTVVGSTNVVRNAWLSGSFLGLGPATIGGELHHTGSVTALPLHAATDITEPVTISPLCPCQADELLDVADLVDQVAQQNDNALFGIDASTLESGAEPRELTLPCGRFYLTRIGGSGKVTIHVAGLVAVFIGDSIDLDEALTVDLAAGAEVDIFVRGNLRATGPINVANQEHPAAGRIYVGGTNEITLLSPWIGNLYAPRAPVKSDTALEVWGAIFSGEFVSQGQANFIFDRAMGLAGRSCAATRIPAGVCTQCGTCFGGTACVDGDCGPCRTDGDCCSQNICANGSCEPLVLLM